jgi:hypothetical protein
MALMSRSRLQWAGQLGDGRAINLGAAVGPDGQAWELQLKVSAAVCVYRNIETGARWWGTVVKVTIIHMGMS